MPPLATPPTLPAPVQERPPRGRARMSRSQRISDVAWRVAFHGGWGARIARHLGLQRPPVTRRHAFVASGRTPGAPTLRIGFASDFHAGATTHPALLREACAQLAALRADVLLFGGDFVSHAARDVAPLLPLLAELSAPLGKLAVIGNHDITGDDARVARQLESAGVRVLTNRAERLAAPHDDVWVCGLDDPIFGDPDGARAVAGADGARVVLMHAPDGLLALGDRAFDVALCGHTHGGQIVLPGGFKPVLPAGRLSRRFAHGEFRLDGGRTLLVSSGVGCSSLPVRLLARPEVHLVELRAPAPG